MAKFKNNSTGKIIEANLLYYVNKYRNDPNYVEIEEKPKSIKKEKIEEKVENKEKIKEEEENIPQ